MNKKRAESQRPKAYSYVRFSTPEQSKGHSLARQVGLSRAYAAKHGFELDEDLSFRDLGVSGFRGDNVRQGALGQFLRAVDEGLVAPGSYLLVESLDRVSRQNPWDALPVFQQIINSGVTIVTLQDERQWSAEDMRANPFRMFESIMVMIRANEESVTKSRRLIDAYERKRAVAASGEPTKRPFTRMLPAWLQWDDQSSAYRVNPERAEVVARMFRMAEEGLSQHSIAQRLNADGLDTWGGGSRKATRWRRSYIRKILINRAAIGTFTPHRALRDDAGKRVRTPLEPIEGHWPAVVSSEVFERVNARLTAAAPRGRNATRPVASIFAGLLTCGHCGGAATRVTKGQHIYLVCSSAHAKAGCEYRAVPYATAESAMVENAGSIVDDAPRGQSDDELQMHMTGLDVHLDELLEKARALVDELAITKSDAVRARLRDTDAELSATREAMHRLSLERDTRAGPFVLARLERLKAALTHTPLDVAAVNGVMKEAVAKVVLDPVGGLLTLHWRHSEETTDVICLSRHTARFDD